MSPNIPAGTLGTPTPTPAATPTPSPAPVALDSVHPIRLAVPNLIVATHYFPGWNSDERDDGNGSSAPWAWENIQPNYSDRKPLQGWYKDGDPSAIVSVQNARLQIKYAAENGINLIIFNWFRRATPATPRTVVPALSNALHNGFMQANDASTGVKFALNFTFESFGQDSAETRMGLTTPFALAGTTPALITEAGYQLSDVLYPYWKATYFSRNDYQRINGRPLILFLAMDNLLRYFGLPQNPTSLQQRTDAANRLRVAMDAMKSNAVAAGDQPPLIGCSFFSFIDPGSSDRDQYQTYLYSVMTAAGCDFHYDYSNGSTMTRTADLLNQTYKDLVTTNPADPDMNFVQSLYMPSLLPQQQSSQFNAALSGYTQLKTWDFYHQFDSTLSSPVTLSVGWHNEPWGGVSSATSSIDNPNAQFMFYLSATPLQTDRPLSPTSYYGLLNQFLNRVQADSTYSRVGGTPMLIVDAWNEYGEGHYIEPSAKFGFSYLETLRSVVGHPDDRSTWPINSQKILYP